MIIKRKAKYNLSKMQEIVKTPIPKVGGMTINTRIKKRMPANAHFRKFQQDSSPGVEAYPVLKNPNSLFATKRMACTGW